MKKQVKRTAASLLTAGLLLSMLAGCGGNNAANGEIRRSRRIRAAADQVLLR